MDWSVALPNIWFLLITILFTGFFVLEGYDFGVGVLAQVLGKNDEEKRVYFNTIGPFWDANEVWLLTGGGAMFAAFPIWYGKLFSGYYIAFVLMLVALILRGVSFEFRGKLGDNRTWIKSFDIARATSALLFPFTAVVTLVFAIWALFKTDIFTTNYYVGLVLALVAVALFVLSFVLNFKGRDLGAFLSTSGTLAFLTLSVFAGMFPRAIINSNDVSQSLFIYDAASGVYTLRLMTIVALFLLPFVLGYQVWSYSIFRKRLTKEDELEY